MKNLLLVFLGGGLGSSVRYLIGRWVGTYYSQLFPVATLLSNVTACFLLGLAIGLADQRQLLSPAARIFWTIGFCGGFSTFSTLSNEALVMVQHGQAVTSLIYVLFSLLLCVVAVLFGQVLVR